MNYRKKHPELFHRSTYLPLRARGKNSQSVVAFARRQGRRWILVAVPRLCWELTTPNCFPLGKAIWEANDLPLPPRAPLAWQSLWNGKRIKAKKHKGKPTLMLADIFGDFPVALLTQG